MKKMAIFVEGATESVFAENLIREIGDQSRIKIETREIRGGNQVPRTVKTLRMSIPTTSQEFFVMIFDCGGDRAVKTRICEEYENLAKSGYEVVIGIRDVRPDFTFADLPKLRVGLKYRLKTKPIAVEFVLGVMEIEAWFLAETAHFSKIDARITLESVRKKLGFDPSVDNLQLRSDPTKDLDDCYALAGKSYRKGYSTVTVPALDFSSVYFELPKKFEDLARLTSTIEKFLT